MAAKKKSTKKTKASKETKKPELKEMSQTHGMSVEKEEKVEASTLEQVWGDTGLFKYKTLDVDVYKKEIGHMNKTDLRNHAIEIGLLPIDDASMLTDRLIREFIIHANSYKKPKQEQEDPRKMTAEAEKILREGR